MSLKPDVLITSVLKADTPHNQIASESVVPRDLICSFKNTLSPQLMSLHNSQRHCSLLSSLSHLCLTDNFVELCLPVCIANAVTAKDIVPKELSKEQTVYERPCSIFYSTLFNAQGVIPWSQKSCEIFVPLSGWCSGDKSFISASVHLSS